MSDEKKEEKTKEEITKEAKKDKDSDELEKEPIKKGLVGVVVDKTEISSIDGTSGKLYYRGYPIRDLVEKSSFEEVAFLLLFGKLPTEYELYSFNENLVRERDLPDRVIMILKSFPRKTTRIELLRTAISALSLYDIDDYVYDEQANIRKGMRIIAKIPTILAFSHRIQTNQPLVEPEQHGRISHAANFYYMMTGNIPEKDIEQAFDKLLICHAEHALNASTFAARVTVSTLSDLYSAITSAIGTLRGPLHGGANEKVINYMLNEIKTKDNVLPWVKGKLERKEKIMGFGHRVYKTWDPRAIILRDEWGKFSEKRKEMDRKELRAMFPDEKGIDSIFDMTEILKDYMIKEKGIYPNVDLYSAGLLHGLNVPTLLYTPLFAASRSVGWVAHAIEQLRNNKLIRPRLLYVGDLDKKFVDIHDR